MFINAEVDLSIPLDFSIAGSQTRSILVVPVAADSVSYPALADALAITPGNAVEDWEIAAQMILRHRQTGGQLPLLVAVDSRLDADRIDERLAIVVPARPDGLIVSGVRTGADLQRIDVMLSVAEAMAEQDPGETAILAIIGDNPAGLLDAGSLAGRTPRLRAVGRNVKALAVAVGIDRQSPAQYASDSTLSLSRGLTVLAAAKAGVTALDWLDPALEGEALTEACVRARADGFGALAVENPEQLAAIAAVYR